MVSVTDFAIIAALEKEDQAVIQRLENHHVERFEDQDIRTYHAGRVTIQSSDQSYRVVVVQLTSMGEISAANAVSNTISRCLRLTLQKVAHR
jgi:nucleoside phosphorylase